MIDSLPVWAIAAAYSEQARLAPVFVAPAPKRERSAVGVVPIIGTLDKPYNVWIRSEVTRLAAESSCSEIILHIDSPGGAASGTADAATAIARAAAIKPVTAFIEDMACSAAYWLASQAGKVLCNRTAIVGSIGVFMAVADTSELFKRIGVNLIVVKSGGVLSNKGMGIEGTKLTAEQVEQLQIRVDALARIFVGDVAKGRRTDVKRIQDHADGRVFVGRAAHAAGLVDQADMTLEDLLAEANTRSTTYRLNSLVGEAAVKAFAELEAAEAGGKEAERFNAEVTIKDRYPSLAESALEDRSEFTKLRDEAMQLFRNDLYERNRR